MSQQICFHLLQTLPVPQQKRLVKRLQESSQPQSDSISLKESTTEAKFGLADHGLIKWR